MTPLLDIQGLRGGYGNVEVLRGVDLHVRPGETVALLGSNGAGKTTLNNVICAIQSAWAGSIRFDGADLSRAHYTDVVKAGLIQVPEGRKIFPNLTVLENLALGSYGRARERRAVNLDKVLGIFPRLQERMTLCNMSAELGAQTGLVAADEVTWQWLDALGPGAGGRSGSRASEVPRQGAVVPQREPTDRVNLSSDPGSFDVQHDFDASQLSPQLAAPHSPAHGVPIADHANTRIDVAYIGACTGAKLDDLRFAAQVLKGKKIASGVQLMVAPASLKDRAQAEAEGTMQALRDAGASVLPSACGVCAGYGDSFADGQTVISSTARNFKGRMGPQGTQVFLASAYTVAASALRGRITDPRGVMA